MDFQPPIVSDIASGRGWRVRDIVCRAKVGEPNFEEMHERHVIALVKKGVFTYHGKGGRDLLHGGALLVGNAGQCYSCGHTHNDGDHCLALQLDDELYAEIASSSAGKMTFNFSTSRLPLHNQLFAASICLEKAIRHGGEMLQEETVLSFIENVLQTAAQATTARQVVQRQSRKVAATIALIENFASEAITLQQLADQAGLSRYHFLRVFKQSTGMTPHQYITQTRLKLAVGLLLSTKQPIIDVALSSGFGDLSTFNKTFKALTGKTPKMLRH
jgi:AraC family transcriptional regulator